jgi:hypothetical protein
MDRARHAGLTLWLFAQSVALMLCTLAAHAAQEGPAEVLKTPIRWKGVEVITNDFDSVGRIREVAALRAGTLLLMSDPKLQAVCDAVRKELSSSKVTCTNVISATPGGPPDAWYLVEVDIKEREALKCASGGAMGEDLLRLRNAWQEAYTKSMLRGVVVHERVNDRKYLDYDQAELSSLARKIHTTTKSRASELESAASSCDPGQRASSFYLMNFVGDPERFVQLAGSHINDSDVGAANAATRFLVVFADFISATDMHSLATQACRSLREGGFTARNKSLWLLSESRESGALSFAQLSAECQQQVRNIARTSIAEQIAVPARKLVGDRVDEPEQMP